MFGFITPNLNALSDTDRNTFRGFYCGLCKTLGDRHGQVTRLGLNYDFTFLALLHAALDNDAVLRPSRCVYNPFLKRPMATAVALECAADCSVLLTALKFEDDIRDENRFTAKLARLLYRPAFQKLSQHENARLDKTRQLLTALYQKESENCAVIDQVADLFGQIMQLFFDRPDTPSDVRENLSRLGYHCGRVVYLLDAVSDLKEDFKRQEYNPLLARFNLADPHGFAGVPAERIRRTLLRSFAEMGDAYSALPVADWAKPILENIIYLGLRGRMDEELKEYEQPV